MVDRVRRRDAEGFGVRRSACGASETTQRYGRGSSSAGSRTTLACVLFSPALRLLLTVPFPLRRQQCPYIPAAFPRLHPKASTPTVNCPSRPTRWPARSTGRSRRPLPAPRQPRRSSRSSRGSASTSATYMDSLVCSPSPQVVPADLGCIHRDLWPNHAHRPFLPPFPLSQVRRLIN